MGIASVRNAYSDNHCIDLYLLGSMGTMMFRKHKNRRSLVALSTFGHMIITCSRQTKLYIDNNIGGREISRKQDEVNRLKILGTHGNIYWLFLWSMLE